MEFSFTGERLASQEIKDSLKDLGLGDINPQFAGENDVLLKLKDVSEDTHQKIKDSLNSAISKKTESAETGAENKTVENKDSAAKSEEIKAEEVKTDSANAAMEVKAGIIEKQYSSIGSVLGRELQQSSVYAIVFSLIAIVLYIGWAFRKVSHPVSSYKYGISATIALFHDVIITVGVFSILGHFFNIEIESSFVAALLTILGYSVSDTIVVFDRTRENLIKSGTVNFEETVNKSVNETFVRSMNSSFTTLLALFSLYLFGGETIRYFILALIVGISFGTYSSIFIASPLLVTWQKWSLRKNR